MKRWIHDRRSLSCLAVALAALFLFQGCGTLLFGKTETVLVDSDPPGADILIQGQVRGTTPAKIRIHRARDVDDDLQDYLRSVRLEEGRKRYRQERRKLGRRPYTIVLQKEGFLPRSENLRSVTRWPRFVGLSLVYMLYFPMLGMQTDFENGVIESIEPKVIHAHLYPDPDAPPGTVGAGIGTSGVGMHVLQMENGDTVQGTLMEYHPRKGYKIKRLDGSTMVFPDDEVVSVERVIAK